MKTLYFIVTVTDEFRSKSKIRFVTVYTPPKGERYKSSEKKVVDLVNSNFDSNGVFSIKVKCCNLIKFENWSKPA